MRPAIAAANSLAFLGGMLEPLKHPAYHDHTPWT